MLKTSLYPQLRESVRLSKELSKRKTHVEIWHINGRRFEMSLVALTSANGKGSLAMRGVDDSEDIGDGRQRRVAVTQWLAIDAEEVGQQSLTVALSLKGASMLSR